MKSVIILFLCFSSIWTLNIQKERPHLVKKNIGGRIIGGDTASETEFPYVAAIWTRTPLGRYFCTGTVIDRQFILTAGHCVLDAEAFEIQVGSISLSGVDTNRVTITATTGYLHPNFNADTLANNVGIIHLPTALRLNDYVNIIKLPASDLVENVPLVSVGWGQIDDEHSGPVNALHKVEVVSLLNEHCKNIYGDQINDNMVCAIGSLNQGTCIGDIGGPLINGEGENAESAGVASFLSGNGCESLDPSGFERTFKYLAWIRNVTGIA